MTKLKPFFEKYLWLNPSPKRWKSSQKHFTFHLLHFTLLGKLFISPRSNTLVLIVLRKYWINKATGSSAKITSGFIMDPTTAIPVAITPKHPRNLIVYSYFDVLSEYSIFYMPLQLRKHFASAGEHIEFYWFPNLWLVWLNFKVLKSTPLYFVILTVTSFWSFTPTLNL